jgi:hypothetical protein
LRGDLDLGIKLRLLLKQAAWGALQIDVKKCVHIIGSDGEPATPMTHAPVTAPLSGTHSKGVESTALMKFTIYATNGKSYGYR